MYIWAAGQTQRQSALLLWWAYLPDHIFGTTDRSWLSLVIQNVHTSWPINLETHIQGCNGMLLFVFNLCCYGGVSVNLHCNNVHDAFPQTASYMVKHGPCSYGSQSRPLEEGLLLITVLYTAICGWRISWFVNATSPIVESTASHLALEQNVWHIFHIDFGPCYVVVCASICSGCARPPVCLVYFCRRAMGAARVPQSFCTLSAEPEAVEADGYSVLRAGAWQQRASAPSCFHVDYKGCVLYDVWLVVVPWTLSWAYIETRLRRCGAGSCIN